MFHVTTSSRSRDAPGSGRGDGVRLILPSRMSSAYAATNRFLLLDDAREQLMTDTTPTTSTTSESWISDAKVAMLTTTTPDGRSVSRPMALQEAEFDGDLWFFAYDDSAKARQISAHGAGQRRRSPIPRAIPGPRWQGGASDRPRPAPRQRTSGGRSPCRPGSRTGSRRRGLLASSGSRPTRRSIGRAPAAPSPTPLRPSARS